MEAVTNGGGGGIVRHHDDGDAVVIHGSAKESQRRETRRRVEGARRFVREDHRRVGNEGAGDSDALALATRQGADVSRFQSREPHRPQDVAQRAMVPRPQATRQQHVLLDGQRRQEVVRLEDEANLFPPEAAQGPLAHSADVVPQEPRGAGGGASNLEAQFMSVLLPEPVAPMMATNSPARTEHVTPARAVTGAPSVVKVRDTSSRSMAFMSPA